MRVTLVKKARMRGDDWQQAAMFSYISPEARVPPAIQSGRSRAWWMRRSRSCRRGRNPVMEQLDYNLLFRWFVELNMDDPVRDPTVFTKNRQRLLERRG